MFIENDTFELEVLRMSLVEDDRYRSIVLDRDADVGYGLILESQPESDGVFFKEAVLRLSFRILLMEILRLQIHLLLHLR